MRPASDLRETQAASLRAGGGTANQRSSGAWSLISAGDGRCVKRAASAGLKGVREVVAGPDLGLIFVRAL